VKKTLEKEEKSLLLQEKRWSTSPHCERKRKRNCKKRSIACFKALKRKRAEKGSGDARCKEDFGKEREKKRKRA